MEEPVKTERQLSEEQLQEITGGCGECRIAVGMLNLSKKLYNQRMWMAEAEAARGNRRGAKEYAKAAAYSARISKESQAVIDALHPPGK